MDSREHRDEVIMMSVVVLPIGRNESLDLGGVLDVVGKVGPEGPAHSPQPLGTGTGRTAMLHPGVLEGSEDEFDGIDEGSVEIEQDRGQDRCSW